MQRSLRLFKLLPLLILLAASSQPAFAQTLQQLLQQGKAAQEAQQYSQAERIWRQVVQQQPQNADAYQSLGDALLVQEGRLKEAIASYRKAADLSPNKAKLYAHLTQSARQLREFGYPEAGVELGQLLLQMNPKDVVAYLDLGLAYRDQYKFEEAVITFRQAVALQPDAETYTHLGDTLGFGLKRWDDAEIVYRKALSLEEDQAGWALMAINSLTEILRMQNKAGEAIALYRQLTQRYPQEPTLYEGLGDLLREEQQLKEATTAYRQFIQRVQAAKDSSDPTLPTPSINDFGVFFKLADVLKAQNQLGEAIQVYRQVLATDPTHQRALVDLADTLQQHQQPDEAIATYHQVLQQNLDPDLAAFIHNDMGLVLWKQGKLQEATQQFQQAIQLLPNYDEAKVHLKQVEKQLKAK